MAAGDEPVTNWGIYRWLFDDRPMHAMVASRILLGFILLANYVDRGLSYKLLYGADAMVWTPMYRNYVQHGYRALETLRYSHSLMKRGIGARRKISR